MRKLVITLLVLAGLLLVADFGAAAAAEYQVAQQLRSELELNEDPQVRIEGFPFLTQAISGNYEHIEVAAEGLNVGPLNNIAVEATLRNVTAPLSAVWTGNLADVRAGHVQGRVRILETDLGQVIGINDLQIEPATGQQTRQARGAAGSTDAGGARATAQMSATTDIAGQRVEVTVITLLQLVDGTVQINATDVRLGVDQFGEFGLPEVFRDPLLSLFSVQVDPGGLPFTVTPTEVTVEPGSIVVRGTASDVSFSQAQLSRG